MILPGTPIQAVLLSRDRMLKRDRKYTGSYHHPSLIIYGYRNKAGTTHVYLPQADQMVICERSYNHSSTLEGLITAWTLADLSQTPDDYLVHEGNLYFLDGTPIKNYKNAICLDWIKLLPQCSIKVDRHFNILSDHLLPSGVAVLHTARNVRKAIKMWEEYRRRNTSTCDLIKAAGI